MGSDTFLELLRTDLPVLFIYVGWSERYEGAEEVAGGHSFLKEHADEAAESEAFLELPDGTHRSGIGPGAVPHERLHVVFVARDPSDEQRKIVGVYAGASVEREGREWPSAIAQQARLLPRGTRPPLPEWPSGQGVRRWAVRPAGSQSSDLAAAFTRLREFLVAHLDAPEATPDAEETGAQEGALETRLVARRQRERRLRQRKIDEVLLATGKLACEVPRCGFDFEATYGALGRGFAEVHHRERLADFPEEGRVTRLRELAVICSNCHRMIHRAGGCRSVESLLVGAT